MRSFRVSRCLLVVLVSALVLAGCARRQAAYYGPAPALGGPYVPAGAQVYATEPSYNLDTGDRVRVSVFGQDGVSNSYLVDAGGSVNIALIDAHRPVLGVVHILDVTADPIAVVAPHLDGITATALGGSPASAAASAFPGPGRSTGPVCSESPAPG